MFAIANCGLVIKFAIKIILEQNSNFRFCSFKESSYSEGFEAF